MGSKRLASDLVLVAYISVSFYVLGCLVVENDVYYPAWRLVGPSSFPSFHAVVEAGLKPAMFAPMTLQLLAGLGLVVLGSARVGRRWSIASVSLTLYVVVESLLVQVPIHRALGVAYDPALLERLIFTHRAYRLPAVLAGGALLLVVLWRALRSAPAGEPTPPARPVVGAAPAR
jgi:hypothetical protein